MFTQRKRQRSLKQFPALKKYQTFTETPKILPTISEYRQAHKNSTKDLTNLIAKFTNNNNKQNLKHSEQLLRSAILVLKGFSQTQNNFQSLFSELYEVFKRFTFAMDDQQIMTILHTYKVKEGFSFRKTCILLEKQLDNVMEDKNQKLRLLNEQYSKLRSTYGVSKVQWAQQKNFLESEVERYKKLADIQYMRSLEQKVESLKATVSELQIQCAKLLKQNDQYLKQIDFKDNKIHDQAYQISKLKADLFDARNKVDQTQLYFNQMRDRFDGLLVKMMGLKEIIAKVQEQNGLLVTQRMKMVNRAAVAFSQLTPRPKYNEIFGTNLKNSGMSTQDIFASLVENSQESKKSIIQIMKQKRKNQKLQQAEALRDKVVDDIISAKKDMDKVQNL